MKNSVPSLPKALPFLENFFRPWRILFTISLMLMGLSLLTLTFRWVEKKSPLNLGVDFTGGTILQMRFQKKLTTAQVHSAIDKLLKKTPGVQISPQPEQTHILLIRTEPLTEEEIEQVQNRIRETLGEYELEGIERVSPAFGKELAIAGIIALSLGWIFILIYMAFRFNLQFGIGAVAAVFHDALIVLGSFSLIYREVNLPFVGALLTIIGYSVNDTVVIFDRIRENQKIYRGMALEEIIRISIAQTFGRSLNTSLTTLFPILSILFIGGITLQSFALALAVGIVSGTYSTWFLASPVTLLLQGAGLKPREKAYIPTKPGAPEIADSQTPRTPSHRPAAFSSDSPSPKKKKEKKAKKKKARRR